jgi:hypothetical protein
MVECVHVGHGCPGLNRLSLAIKGYNFSTETVVKSKIELTPEVACRLVQTSRHEKDGTWSELT